MCDAAVLCRRSRILLPAYSTWSYITPLICSRLVCLPNKHLGISCIIYTRNEASLCRCSSSSASRKLLYHRASGQRPGGRLKTRSAFKDGSLGIAHGEIVLMQRVLPLEGGGGEVYCSCSSTWQLCLICLWFIFIFPHPLQQCPSESSLNPAGFSTY